MMAGVTGEVIGGGRTQEHGDQRMHREGNGFAFACHQVVAARPEERLINDYAVVQEGARKLVAGAAFLAVTVVLLGGLVTELPDREFWLVTLMSLVFGSR